MKVIKTCETLVEKISRYVGYISGIALVFNTLLIVAYILGRIIELPIIGTEEYVSFAQVIVISLAFGYTHHNGGLVYVCFFMKKLPGKSPFAAWLIDSWLSAVICGLLAYQSIARIPFVRQQSTMLTIPHKPFFIVMTIGLSIYFLSQLFEAVKCTVGIFNKEIRKEIEDNWPA